MRIACALSIATFARSRMDIYSQGTCPEDALQDWFAGLGSKFFIVADVNGSLLDFALDDTLGAARGSGATIRFLSSYRVTAAVSLIPSAIATPSP